LSNLNFFNFELRSIISSPNPKRENASSKNSVEQFSVI